MTYKEIIDHIPVLIYGLEYNPALGPQTGSVAYCNRTMVDFVKYTEDEIVGMGFDFFKEILHPNDLYKTAQTVDILLHSGLNEHYEFYRVKAKKDDDYVFMKVFCRLVQPVQKDKLVQMIVTSLKASEEEVKQYFPEN